MLCYQKCNFFCLLYSLLETCCIAIKSVTSCALCIHETSCVLCGLTHHDLETGIHSTVTFEISLISNRPTLLASNQFFYTFISFVCDLLYVEETLHSLHLTLTGKKELCNDILYMYVLFRWEERESRPKDVLKGNKISDSRSHSRNVTVFDSGSSAWIACSLRFVEQGTSFGLFRSF